MKKKKISDLPVSAFNPSSNILAVNSGGLSKSPNAVAFIAETGSIQNLDTIYKTTPAGISMHNATGGVSGSPVGGGNGSILHLQRIAGDNNSGSQVIMQIASLQSGLYIRRGQGNETTITYTSWKRLD